MKAVLITVILLVLTGSIAGCGQKGPLYPETRGEMSAEQDPG